MSQIKAHLDVKADAKSIQELNKEIGQLKMVIGFMLAKLPGHDQEHVINELKEWGLTESSKEFDQFVHPRIIN